MDRENPYLKANNYYNYCYHFLINQSFGTWTIVRNWYCCFIFCVIHQITFSTHYSVKKKTISGHSWKATRPKLFRITKKFIMENIKNKKAFGTFHGSRFRWLVLDFCCVCFILCVTHIRISLMHFSPAPYTLRIIDVQVPST